MAASSAVVVRGYRLHSMTTVLRTFRYRRRRLAVFAVAGQFAMVDPKSDDFDGFAADDACDWVGTYDAQTDLHELRQALIDADAL